MAQDMPPHKRPTVANSELVHSTRLARLVKLAGSDGSIARSPLFLLPGPTWQDAVATTSLIGDLMRVRPPFSPPIYLLQWQTLWPDQGQARFTPLIRALHDILAPLARLHLSLNQLTIGSGALLLMRSGDLPVTNTLPLDSLSFYNPELNLQNRRPRLQTPHFPTKTSLICLSQTLPDLPVSFLKRIAIRRPDLFLYEDPTWFARDKLVSQYADQIKGQRHSFAGYWLRSWLDWLEET